MAAKEQRLATAKQGFTAGMQELMKNLGVGSDAAIKAEREMKELQEQVNAITAITDGQKKKTDDYQGDVLMIEALVKRSKELSDTISNVVQEVARGAAARQDIIVQAREKLAAIKKAI